MIGKVLIANRGEIAVRIAQACQEAGIAAVAVHSDPDASALHVMAADEAYSLPGDSSADTYLRGDRIIEIAKRCGADAIHPGYGFLAENAEFAQACGDAGLVFIGPSPDVIRAMGDKIVAKRWMEDAGVPVVPGWSGDGEADAAEFSKRANAIGYPVLVKAAAGGGGKGMRVAEDESQLQAGLESARREAGAAFGDARVFLEKYLPSARHVEFQVFGDSHGNIVHMFERECSIQRRHQKIVEESPSPALTPELRERMGLAAISAAKAIGYTNAGTVEFLLAPDGSFYFLEMNTRLQVEHPVTELVTQQDLVAVQLAVADGKPLPFVQDDLSQTGHAIECRIYAEEPERGFLPSTGTIARWQPPVGQSTRVDTGVTTGSRVDVYYDPMLAKLIVWGASRDEAINRMRWALSRFVVLGVTTNIAFLHDVVGHKAFRAGDIDTHFLDHHAIEPEPPNVEAFIAAALASQQSMRAAAPSQPGAREASGPWETAGHWRCV